LATTPWIDPWFAARCNQESREERKEIHCEWRLEWGQNLWIVNWNIRNIVKGEREEVENDSVTKGIKGKENINEKKEEVKFCV